MAVARPAKRKYRCASFGYVGCGEMFSLVVHRSSGFQGAGLWKVMPMLMQAYLALQWQP